MNLAIRIDNACRRVRGHACRAHRMGKITNELAIIGGAAFQPWRERRRLIAQAGHLLRENFRHSPDCLELEI